QPRPGRAARHADDHPRAREDDLDPCRSAPGPHLQPRPRRPPEHARRARGHARRHGPRAERAVIDSILLIAFGGPTSPAEIRPFLEIVTRGRRIPPERLEEVGHHYEQMPGGRSPFRELTEAQADGLRRTLLARGRSLPVWIGMRNWHPFLHETLAAMAARGQRRALGIILSSFRTEASWERYQADVAAARDKTRDAPEVVFAPPWFEHPRFVAAIADGAGRTLENVPVVERAETPLVFTAHSV